MGDLQLENLSIRPDYLQAHDDAPDKIGRKIPRPFSFLRLLLQFTDKDWKPVPSEYWALDVNEDGFSIAVVSCLCGNTPRVEVLGPAVDCDGCHRFFYFGGDEVRVAYGDDEAAGPSPSP